MCGSVLWATAPDLEVTRDELTTIFSSIVTRYSFQMIACVVSVQRMLGVALEGHRIGTAAVERHLQAAMDEALEKLASLQSKAAGDMDNAQDEISPNCSVECVAAARHLAQRQKHDGNAGKI